MVQENTSRDANCCVSPDLTHVPLFVFTILICWVRLCSPIRTRMRLGFANAALAPGLDVLLAAGGLSADLDKMAQRRNG